MNKWLFIGIATLAISASSLANEHATEQRQALFQKIEEGTERLENIIDKRDWLKTTSLAQQLSHDVLRLKTLFPAHSRGEGRSKDKIWSNKNDFNQRLDTWSLSFKALEQATQNKSIREVENALDEATSTCRSCHMKYRSLW